MGPSGVGTDRLASLSPARRALVEKLLRARQSGEPPELSIRRRPSDRSARLSFAQRRLWFLDQLAPGNPLYNMALATRVSAPFDVAAMERAINAIVARHEILRTTFSAQDGEPLQIVHRELHVPLHVVDLRDLQPSDADAEATRLATIEARTPFDLERGPLIRTTLLKLSDTSLVFLLTMHHIVGDGWSMLVFSRELSVLYQPALNGGAPPLPELPIQYADYAEWQQGVLTGPLLEKHLAYWRQKLDRLPVLQLPTDRPRPRVQAFRGAFHALSVDRPVADAVRALSRSCGATVYMTMLAAFVALLHRCTGQSDVVVGSPVAGRTRREVEPLIGFFVNSLVLRTDASGNPTFLELLRRVQKTVLEAFAHQDLPFERLVEELQPERDPSRNPLFQVTFQLFTPPTGTGAVDPVHSPLLVHRGTAMFDLALSLGDNGQSFTGGIEYDTDLFDADSIERLGTHLLTVLEDAVREPHRAISELRVMSEPEHRRVVVEWNQTARNYGEPRLLDALVDLQLRRTPGRVAVSCGGVALTYQELDGRSRELARQLVTLGVGPERVVGVCLERSVDMVLALLGVLRAGGAYVPLDPSYPRDRLEFMLADSGSALLVTDARRAEQHQREGLTVVAMSGSDPVRIVEGSRAAGIDREGNAARGPGNAAYVIYTSGSTGRPKGVVIEHAAICNHMRWMQERFPLAASDRVLQRTPFSFDASVWEFYAPLLAGGCLVLAGPDDRDPAAMVRLLRDERITILQVVPSFLELLLDEPGFDGGLDLRRVFCGGEALPSRTVRRFHDRFTAELCNLYGPTEATIDASFWVSTGETPGTTAPIGRPIANTELYVLDAARRPVPVGVVGELYIGGDGLARGYLNRPEITAERFVPHPFDATPGARVYRTGDAVRYLLDGDLEFLGRVDEQVKLRGYRIEPGEVEEMLVEHPVVREAVVTCATGDGGDQRLLACILPQPGPEAPARDLASDAARTALVQDLRGHLRQRLPEFMIPDTFVFVDELPRLPSGKVDRQALARAGGQSWTPEAYVAPRDETEATLATLWMEVLRVPRVGVHDNFFNDLGGHSLLATQLTARIRRTFGIEFPLQRLFETPTIAELAPGVAEARRDPSRRGGDGIRPVTSSQGDAPIRSARHGGGSEDHS